MGSRRGSAYRAVPPASLTDGDLADVVEPRSVGLAFGSTADAAWFGNGILAWGGRQQLVATLRDAARSYVLTGQEPVTVSHDPAPRSTGSGGRLTVLGGLGSRRVILKFR